MDGDISRRILLNREIDSNSCNADYVLVDRPVSYVSLEQTIVN